MNYDIKRCVDNCNIHEKKLTHEKNQIKMFQLDRAMAKMKFDRQIGLYAFKLDRYEYLTKILNTLTIKNQASAKLEIIKLQTEINNMKDSEKIKEYIFLREEYNSLKESLSDYPKSINIALRQVLNQLALPNIYIYTEDNKIPVYRHIILDSETIPLAREENIVIYSPYQMQSNREFRHFYSKTSFKYLAELAEDYSFDIETKKMNKIRIKKM